MKHPPQFATELSVSTSQPFAGLASQSTKPRAQVNPHAPAAQVGAAFARAGHTVPHAPQFVTAVRVSTSQPSARAPSQSANPAVQARPHAPAVHTGAALAGVAQAVAQAPQWASDVRVSTSQPFAASPSQSAKPAAQAKPHAPAAQVGVALARAGGRHGDVPGGRVRVHLRGGLRRLRRRRGGRLRGRHAHQRDELRRLRDGVPRAGHALPHAPQWASDARVSTSQPLATARSQSPKPSVHVPTAHAPTAHADSALAAAHTVPQPPQFPTLVRMSTHPPPQHVCPATHPRVASQPGTH